MYKIGTRGSLLAVTQCTLVKQLLEQLSGQSFELDLIKTQGDQIVDRPLWQLEGKDFFTKELDEALLAKKVDMVVHSYKDLGSDRPQGIKLSVITERRYAHDILLIKKSTALKLKNWSGDFIVGTSSPRRIVNLTRDLPAFLPGTPKVKCETLRGNINTRIQKLKDDQYHAITLALAGVDRLAQLDNSLKELTTLLDGLTFAILPLSIFPTAAAQGALAIETRGDNPELEAILKKIHHERTAEEVRRERLAFKSYGGGCHLAVGIHVREMDGDFLHFHRGETDGKDIRVKKREGATVAMEHVRQVFLGQGEHGKALCDENFVKTSLPVKLDLKRSHVFVTTGHALDAVTEQPASLWAAGPETRKKLVAKGFWVHGGADSMGHGELVKLKISKALQLMLEGDDWKVLTHKNSQSPIGEVIAAYEHKLKPLTDEQIDKLEKVTHAWWSSYPQFEAYIAEVPELKSARHFCGLGKTRQSFKQNDIEVTALTDSTEFLQLTGLL
jgi:hydroxymethylbilane synthase